MHGSENVSVGQKSYNSVVSGRTEYQAIVSTLVGAKGSDLMLANLAEETLTKAGWPTTVQTGRFTFPPGDNKRNVGT